jgi:hypothetical protein
MVAQAPNHRTRTLWEPRGVPDAFYAVRWRGAARRPGHPPPQRSFIHEFTLCTHESSIDAANGNVCRGLADSTRGSYRRSSTQRTSKLKRLERSRYAPNLDNFPP